MAKAGTGTGKSLASVIPSLSYAIRTGGESKGPVVVSTATKALQGQYYKKDLPFMAQHFNPHKGRDGFSHAILKGKKNYLCLDRLASPAGPVPIEIIKKLQDLPSEHEGDVAELGLARPHETALTTSSDDCPGPNECLYNVARPDNSPSCYYERAKLRAGKADVMVVNHALLAMHVKIMAATEGSIALLPLPEAIVLDECHKFLGYMQNAIGWSLTRNRLFRWANACLDGPDLERFKGLVKDLFSQVILFDKQDKDRQQIVERDTLCNNQILISMLEMVSDALDFWSDEATDKRDTESRRNLRKTANMLADLEVAVEPDNGDNFWVELDKQDNKILNYRPSETKTAEFLSEHMWPMAPTILLSATTPTPKSLGLPNHTDEFEADSPFDYKRNSRLYISGLDGSAPFDRMERELWEQRRYNEMFRLVASSDGRALLLFTSWVDLNKAYDYLNPKLDGKVTVLKQDKENESERDKLARLFKQDETSVLFGTESFFEGIDVPGKSLQLVVISKLPFPAMIDNTRGGKLDFGKEMLPEMRKKLVQAAGRLIRNHTDQGLVAVLDSRLSSKAYGRNVLSNISPFNEMTRVRSLADACEYLESLEEGGDDA